ncbi:hypothetical protein CATMIT_01708, partial [Catenibacterium mitsuokai DSM 15897]
MRQAHQHVVADQIGLGQRLAGGVHALEDHLRVVDALLQTHVHDHQFSDAGIDHLQIGLGDLSGEELEVLLDAVGGLVRHWLAVQQG